MPATPQSAFAPDACIGMGAGSTSSRVALPGTLGGDTVVRVVNIGPDPAAVQLGDVTVVAVNNTSLMVNAGDTQYLVLGAATYIAAISIGKKAILNICTGN
jgi:hypothetical protein